MKYHNGLKEDIDKRFREEEKNIVYPEKNLQSGKFVSIAISLLMVLVVIISTFYTFISLLG